MTITLHCIDCGFRLSVTLPPHESAAALAETLSCGHCRSRRWVTS
jgi:hypothetical protein